MKFLIAFLCLQETLLTSLFVTSYATTVDIPSDNIVQNAISSRRHLAETIFEPLDCNIDLDSEPCTSWEESFGDLSSHESKVVIECGTCITMDFRGDSLLLQGG